MTVADITLDQTFPIFLSSLCRRAPGLEDLRAQIYDEVGDTSLVYVDEQVKQRDIAQQDDLFAADELIARVREASEFICVLAGSSHGTAIRVDGLDSNSSFFEIELFQAALLRKRVHILVRNDFDPEPRLETLLRILGDAFPEWTNVKRLTNREIFAETKRIADSSSSYRRRIFPFALRVPIARLVQAFYAARARNRPSPSILFLHGATDPGLGKPRVEVIRPLVNDIQRQSNEEKRLSRLWIALRELMAIHHRAVTEPEMIGYWNRLLADWARAGAWYGLHGHTPLGCLAALNTLTQVRTHIATHFRGTAGVGDKEFPGGALASAKYSIAKRLYVKLDRSTCFDEALCDLGRSLDVERGDRSGLLAIRGSIMRQLGRMADCIKDYEEVLRIRRERNAPPSQIGEAMSELGHAYLLQLSPRKGLRFCEEGVEKLREGVRAGVLVRGLRKLAITYAANGRLVRAYKTWEEAKDVAIRSGALDQL